MKQCTFLVRLILDLNQAEWDEDDIIDYVNELIKINIKGEEK